MEGRTNLTATMKDRFAGTADLTDRIINVVGVQEGMPQQAQPSTSSSAQPRSGAPSEGQPPGPRQATHREMASINRPAELSRQEKCRQIRLYLVLLLHAHQCRIYEESRANSEMRQCIMSIDKPARIDCKTMKNVVWKHITNCQAGKNCTTSFCNISKKIFTHWQYCKDNLCPVCAPTQTGI